MLRRIQTSNAYRPVAWAWRWWGWFEDHLGRVASLVIVLGALGTGFQFVWGRFVSDWPGYALYLTTLASVTAVFVVVLLTVIASRGQLVIQNTVVPVADAPSSARRASVRRLGQVGRGAVGIPWRRRWHVGVRANGALP